MPNVLLLRMATVLWISTAGLWAQSVSITDVQAGFCQPNCVDLAPITPSHPAYPGDLLAFTLTAGYSTPPPGAVVRVQMIEISDKGSTDLSPKFTRPASGASGTGLFDNLQYTVPSAACTSAFSCGKAKVVSEIRFTAQMVSSSGVVLASSAARSFNQFLYPTVQSITPNHQTMQSTQTVRVTLNHALLTQAENIYVLLYRISDRTASGADRIIYFSTSWYRSLPNVVCDDLINLQGGYGMCNLKVIDDNTLEFTLRTIYDPQERDDESLYYADYALEVDWYTLFPGGNTSGIHAAWEANPIYSISAPPHEEALVLTDVKAQAINPTQTVTLHPGQDDILPYAPGTQVVFTWEGTYKLTRTKFASLWYGIREATSKNVIIRRAALAINTQGGTLPMSDRNDRGGTFPLTFQIAIPNPPVALEFFVTLNYYLGNDPFANTYAQTSLVAGTQVTADLAVTFVQAVQVVHNFPPQVYVGPGGTDYKSHEMPLIAGKPTVLRVFIKSRGVGAPAVNQVSAVLHAYTDSAFTPNTPDPYMPFSGRITARPYNGPIPLTASPDFTEPSIDFELPMKWVNNPGAYTLRVEIKLPPGVTDPDLSNNTMDYILLLYEQPSGLLSAVPGMLRVGYISICNPLPGPAIGPPPPPSCPSPDVGTYTRFVNSMFPVAAGGYELVRIDAPYTPDDTVLTSSDYGDILRGYLRHRFEDYDKAHGDIDFLIGFINDVSSFVLGPGDCPDTLDPPPCFPGGRADARWLPSHINQRNGTGRVALITDSTPQDALAHKFSQPTGAARTDLSIAHELGHLLGLRHVPQNDPPQCAGPPANEGCPNWPYLNPRIQFPGYDVAHSRVLPDNRFYELMSYCKSTTTGWVAPYTYRWLFDSSLVPDDSLPEPWNPCLTRPVGVPNVVAPRPLAKSPSQPPAAEQNYLLVSGTARTDGSAGTLRAAFQYSTSRPALPGNPDGSWCLRFFDGAAAGLGDYCFALETQDQETGARLVSDSFSFLVAAPAGMASLSLLYNGNTLATLAGGGQPPAVAITAPQSGDTWQGGVQRLVWSASGSGSGALSYLVDYSNDGGSTWSPIGAATSKNQLAIDPATLNGGGNVFFRVQASDGLNTAAAQVGPITITQAPLAAVTPKTMDFRYGLVAQPVERLAMLNNNGSGPLHVSAVQMSSTAFQLVSPHVPFTVAAHDSVALDVRFSAPGTSQTQATMTITSDAGDSPTLSVPLQGTGISSSTPDAAVTPSPADFGSVAVGSTQTLDVTVQNFGPAELNVSLYSVTGTAFSLSDPPAAFTLPANNTQTITIKLSTAQAGAQTGSLTLNCDDPNQPTIAVPLRATVTAPDGGNAPSIGVSPAALDFGSVAPGQTKDLAVTISNTGKASLTVSRLSVIGSAFTVVTQAPVTVAAGTSAAVTVRFAPSAAGAQSGSLTIASNDAAKPSVTVSLSGTGAATGPAVAPAISVAPASLDFGAVGIGQTRDLPLTVSNKGNAPLGVTALAVTGSGFSVTGPSVPFTVAAGASTTATLRFAPASGGAASGRLTVGSNDPAQASVTVPLTGSAGSISTSPALLDYGTVNLGQNKDLSLTITNKGTTALVVSSIASSSAQFVPTAATATIPAGGSTNVSVRFTPASVGAQSGTLTLASNDPVTPSVKVPLTGTGVSAAAGDTVLKVDGGTFNASLGYPNGVDRAYFVNRLTPPSYPATLKSVQVYFGNRANGLKAGTAIQLITGVLGGVLNLLPSTVGSLGSFNTYAVPAITITSGDFVVGFAATNPAGILPADLDQSTASQKRSYISNDGATYNLLDANPGTAGNLGIRAVVTLGQ